MWSDVVRQIDMISLYATLEFAGGIGVLGMPLALLFHTRIEPVRRQAKRRQGLLAGR